MHFNISLLFRLWYDWAYSYHNLVYKWFRCQAFKSVTQLLDLLDVQMVDSAWQSWFSETYHVRLTAVFCHNPLLSCKDQDSNFSCFWVDIVVCTSFSVTLTWDNVLRLPHWWSCHHRLPPWGVQTQPCVDCEHKSLSSQLTGRWSFASQELGQLLNVAMAHDLCAKR